MPAVVEQKGVQRRIVEWPNGVLPMKLGVVVGMIVFYCRRNKAFENIEVFLYLNLLQCLHVKCVSVCLSEVCVRLFSSVCLCVVCVCVSVCVCARVSTQSKPTQNSTHFAREKI